MSYFGFILFSIKENCLRIKMIHKNRVLYLSISFKVLENKNKIIIDFNFILLNSYIHLQKIRFNLCLNFSFILLNYFRFLRNQFSLYRFIKFN